MESISLPPDPAFIPPGVNVQLKEPFRFAFKGYSIWLEVSQTDRDLEKAIASVSLENSIFPVPEPHCTVLYGVSHLSEDTIRSIFREKIAPIAKDWPALETKGSQVGVSFDGVDGEEMDMAWMEVSLKTSPEHEKRLDDIHACLFDQQQDCTTGSDPHYEYKKPRQGGPWQPHLSIAYDNPEGTTVDDICADKIFAKFPSLLGRKSRKVVGISLWRTEGKIWDWECLDKVQLPDKNK